MIKRVSGRVIFNRAMLNFVLQAIENTPAVYLYA